MRVCICVCVTTPTTPPVGRGGEGRVFRLGDRLLQRHRRLHRDLGPELPDADCRHAGSTDRTTEGCCVFVTYKAGIKLAALLANADC